MRIIAIFAVFYVAHCRNLLYLKEIQGQNRGKLHNPPEESVPEGWNCGNPALYGLAVIGLCFTGETKVS